MHGNRGIVVLMRAYGRAQNPEAPATASDYGTVTETDPKLTVVPPAEP
jgi:hypothetical protein